MAPRPKKETRAENARRAPSDDYVSQFYIDPAMLDNENFHYRWVETHCMNAETQSVERAIRDGYEPVQISQMEGMGAKSELISAIRGRPQKDLFVRNGEQILMRCPRGIYKGLKAAERKESKRMTERMDWAQQSQSIKAPTFVEVAEGSRTYGKGFAEDE